jgi:hypothetical protein
VSNEIPASSNLTSERLDERCRDLVTCPSDSRRIRLSTCCTTRHCILLGCVRLPPRRRRRRSAAAALGPFRRLLLPRCCCCFRMPLLPRCYCCFRRLPPPPRCCCCCGAALLLPPPLPPPPLPLPVLMLLYQLRSYGTLYRCESSPPIGQRLFPFLILGMLVDSGRLARKDAVWNPHFAVLEGRAWIGGEIEWVETV